MTGGFARRFGAFGQVAALSTNLAGERSSASPEGQHGDVVGGQWVRER